MNVAVTDHGKKLPCNFEIFGVNNAVLDREAGRGISSNAVTGAGNNRSHKSGQWTENRNRKNVAVSHRDFAVALHQSRLVAHAVEIVIAVKLAVSGLVVVIEIGQAREI